MQNYFMDSSLENGRLGSYEEMHNQDAAQRGFVEWLKSVLPDLNLPIEASEADIRACLLDGTVLCCFLNKLIPGSVEMQGDGAEPQSATIWKFLVAMDRMGLPRFDVSDLEKGSLVEVFQCLQRLREYIHINADGEVVHNHARKRWNQPEGKSFDAVDRPQRDDQQPTIFGASKHRISRDSKYQTQSSGSAMAEISTSVAGSKLAGMIPAKKGHYSDILNMKISELTKWNGLDKAPLQLLFSLIENVLNESLGRKNGDVPHHAACLLRKLVQEIERRISSQADKTKNQNILTKSREGKYRAKVRALETLGAGAIEEIQVVTSHLQQMKAEKIKLGVKKKHDEQNVDRLLREIDQHDNEIVALKQEREDARTSYENRCLQLEKNFKDTKTDLENKIEHLDCLLKESKEKVDELETISSIQIQNLKKKDLLYHNFIGSHCNIIQGLRMDLDYVRAEVLRTKNSYLDEFQNFGTNLKELVDAADNYHMVLSENCRLYNEVQDLKGNIRVYCRIRPFLPGESEIQSTIEYIGENGELVVTNPLKQGKDNHRLFKFNKVFAQTATQEEIYKDTQPLIRSVLDGYNVCIFAYGQTGSGKTYTMSGPDISSQKDWGVNYRALHDLFQISQSRRTSILYEVGVQMVEIYNEQVRDLLASDGPQKRLGIWSTAQPNGLAVPEASMYPVKSTNDVLELMNIGLMNRAVGATALNERSSRSHSILTVHVHGTDLKSNSLLHGCLHLVDLAGSERVDRSEATGDRLREAQHINKSLSALGDVIFALSRKSPHVPYRNSKLTQVLQSSLGGQAKTLMFVQLNPDPESHSESISTLKFAERVSGVELGAARSNKEGRDLRDLMEQISFMKEVIARKDEEIERLQLVKVNGNVQKNGVSITRIASDLDTSSENSDRHFKAGSQHSVDNIRINKKSCRQPVDAAPYMALNANDNIDFQGSSHVDPEERLTDIFDNGFSVGTETDDSICSVEEHSLFPEAAKPAEAEVSEKSNITSKHPKPPRKQASASSSKSAPPKTTGRLVSSLRKVPAANGLATRPKSNLVKR